MKDKVNKAQLKRWKAQIKTLKRQIDILCSEQQALKDKLAQIKLEEGAEFKVGDHIKWNPRDGMEYMGTVRRVLPYIGSCSVQYTVRKRETGLSYTVRPYHNPKKVVFTEWRKR